VRVGEEKATEKKGKNEERKGRKDCKVGPPYASLVRKLLLA
jgi:hypothetical protein